MQRQYVKNIQDRTFDPECVRQNFAPFPVYYDYRTNATESKASKRVLELAEIGEQESVLEVGVGTGLLFEFILQENRSGLAAGIDLSSDMLAQFDESVPDHKPLCY